MYDRDELMGVEGGERERRAIAPGRRSRTERWAGRPRQGAAPMEAPPAPTNDASPETEDPFGMHLLSFGDQPPTGGGPPPKADDEREQREKKIIGNPLRGLRFNDGNDAEPIRRQLAENVRCLRLRLRDEIAKSPELKDLSLSDGTVFDMDTVKVLRAVEKAHGFKPGPDGVGIGDDCARFLWSHGAEEPKLETGHAGEATPLDDLRPGDGALPERSSPEIQKRVRLLQEKLNEHTPGEIVPDGRFVLDNKTLLTYHRFLSQIGEPPSNGPIKKRVAELLWFGLKEKQPTPQPPPRRDPPGPNPQPGGLEWKPEEDPFTGLRVGDGANDDTLERRPYIRKLQAALGQYMTAELVHTGVIDAETTAVLHHAQKKAKRPILDVVDCELSKILQQGGDNPAYDEGLETIINRIWMRHMMNMQHARNAVDAVGDDIKKPPKFRFPIALMKLALRTPFSLLLGDWLPDIIVSKVFDEKDTTTGHSLGTLIIKPLFSILKDGAGDVIQMHFDNLPEKKNDPDEQRAAFTQGQREVVTQEAKMAQDVFLADSAPKLRREKDNRLGKAKAYLRAMEQTEQGYYAKQYFASTQAWATMQAHNELNKNPPADGQPDPTDFKNKPDDEREIKGVLDASFNAEEANPTKRATLVDRPTLRGVPESAAKYFKGQTFKDLSAMPMVARIHLAPKPGLETMDLFVESTEVSKGKRPKDKDVDDFGPEPERRNALWAAEHNKNEQERHRARTFLSLKHEQPPDDIDAHFGAEDFVREIEPIQIPDIDIKP